MELQELIIETPMCEMYRSGYFICEINEYTFRNIQIAVKEGKVNNDFDFINKAGESTKLKENGGFLPHFPTHMKNTPQNNPPVELELLEGV